MAKGTYILSPGATGDIHTSPLLGKEGKKTKFELDKPDTLSQDDLEFLYENKHTNHIIKVEKQIVPVQPAKIVKTKEE